MQGHVKSKPFTGTLALILLFCCMSFKCGGGTRIPEPLVPATKASDDLARLISGTIDLKRKLAHERRITPVEESKLNDLLMPIYNGDIAFDNQFERLLKSPNAIGRDKLLDLLENLDSAIEAFNKNG